MSLAIRKVESDDVADVADVLPRPWFELSVLASALIASAISMWEALRGYIAWRPPASEWSV